MGHMVTKMELDNFLRVVKADREDNKFILAGTVVSFMGTGNEYVIGDDAVYFINGQACNLAHGLQGTSYGTKVGVIY